MTLSAICRCWIRPRYQRLHLWTSVDRKTLDWTVSRLDLISCLAQLWLFSEKEFCFVFIVIYDLLFHIFTADSWKQLFCEWEIDENCVSFARDVDCPLVEAINYVSAAPVAPNIAKFTNFLITFNDHARCNVLVRLDISKREQRWIARGCE